MSISFDNSPDHPLAGISQIPNFEGFLTTFILIFMVIIMYSTHIKRKITLYIGKKSTIFLISFSILFFLIGYFLRIKFMRKFKLK